ncbi:MAG: hypothetical protein COY39_03760 [Alphaproteobacteria bacterium CG_4_10_14_0_8_um_filter_37_21]|nr:MAG: hypothetical protein COY39_03760 [Alphaproteobacteria bacterium CG_4_10_14_0_8_um_filter_37_21]
MLFKKITLSILLIPFFCFGQETNFYDENNNNTIFTNTENPTDKDFRPQNYHIITEKTFQSFLENLENFTTIAAMVNLVFSSVDFKINGHNIIAFLDGQTLGIPNTCNLTSIVGKISNTSEEKDLLSILLFLKKKNCSTYLALPKCFISIGRNTYCTLYHKAEGKQADIPINKFGQHSKPDCVLAIIRRIAHSLFDFHDILRPSKDEIDSFMKSEKASLKFYLGETDSPPCTSPVGTDATFLRLFLSINHGDLHTGNIFITAQEKITFIDFLSMARNLPDRDGYAPITNDVSYFIACTFCHHRELFKKPLGRGLLLHSMVHFLAAYLSHISPDYHQDFFYYIYDHFKMLLKHLIFPGPENQETRIHFYDIFSLNIIPETRKILESVACT